MIQPRTVLVCLVITLSTAAHCKHLHHGRTKGEVRTVVIRAIARAKVALQRQNELNRFYRDIGQDESRNLSPFKPKTCNQHYAVYSFLRPPAEAEADSGFIVSHAAREISQVLGVSIDGLRRSYIIRQYWHGYISSFCTARDVSCDTNAKYRTIDGSCNNLKNPLWGRSNRQHRRLLQPVYDDDINSPRQISISGNVLPSSRSVSNAVHNQDPCCPLEEKDFSQFVQQWGQMLDHDITDTAFARGTDDAAIMCCDLPPERLMERLECFPIPVEPGDERFQNQACLTFVRSTAAPGDDCEIGRRQQLNQATSFIDASFLYGHNDEDARQIRSFMDGKLKITMEGLFPGGQEDLTHCQLSDSNEFCMKSGDFRIHEMPGLTAVQVMFLREHNRIASILQNLNPQWTDEDIYQEARKIVIGQVQHITYSDWLPIILGQEAMMRLGLTIFTTGHSNVYNSNTNPTITNIFGVSAFRFGHTLLRDTVLVEKNGDSFVKNEDVFNRPGIIFSDMGRGAAQVGRGLSLNPSSKADEKVVNSVRNNLFLDENGRSMDLISLNIQRARDHAVPGYNEWRRFCGLPFAIQFNSGPGGLVDHSEENARKLSSVYRHVEDIDIFPGGLSETPLPGGLVGPLFNCIIGLQFQDLKFGDRFYYENEGRTGFTLNQINTLKKITLSKLICLHFNQKQVQEDPFRRPGESNQLKDCNDFEDIDFEQWRM
ncbi:peroxidase-like [Mercenaria mercenaria]|uniref:peroxidase-like n=1 Tax=Mercenaria mercenaria TaxID=6596 RepID=UPI00234E6E41|nr:peroxidase-like [Mercenaria mercenaria]